MVNSILHTTTVIVLKNKFKWLSKLVKGLSRVLVPLSAQENAIESSYVNQYLLQVFYLFF